MLLRSILGHCHRCCCNVPTTKGNLQLKSSNQGSIIFHISNVHHIRCIQFWMLLFLKWWIYYLFGFGTKNSDIGTKHSFNMWPDGRTNLSLFLDDRMFLTSEAFCTGFYFKVVPPLLLLWVAEWKSNASSARSTILYILFVSKNSSSSLLKVSLKFTLRSGWLKIITFSFLVSVVLELSITVIFRYLIIYPM